MEVGTTKARTCSWILLRPSSPVQKLSKSYKLCWSSNNPFGHVGISKEGTSPCAKVVSSLWGRMPFSRLGYSPQRWAHTAPGDQSQPPPAPPSLLSITLTQAAGLGHNTSKKEAHWFDSPLGNKTSLQPRKHDLQRMTEGTGLFSLVKTENRHFNAIWNTWQVGGKNNLFPFPTADWTWQNQTWTAMVKDLG